MKKKISLKHVQFIAKQWPKGKGEKGVILSYRAALRTLEVMNVGNKADISKLVDESW